MQQENVINYTVKKGDTLWAIAKQYLPPRRASFFALIYVKNPLFHGGISMSTSSSVAGIVSTTPEDNADDLQLTFDDRERKWLGDWLKITPTIVSIRN